MRNVVRVIVTLLAAYGAIAPPMSGAANAADPEAATPGMTAKALNVRLDIPDGSPTTLRSLQGGRDVFVDIFATWCDACTSEIRTDVNDYKRLHNKLAFVLIDEREPAAEVEATMRSLGVPYAVVLDGPDTALVNSGSLAERRLYQFYGAPGPYGRFAEALNLKMLPAHLLLNKRGEIRAAWFSAEPNSDGLTSRLNALPDLAIGQSH